LVGWCVGLALPLTVHCYISVAEKHKTMLRLMTENNKYKQIIELNPKPLLNIAVVIKRLLWNL